MNKNTLKQKKPKRKRNIKRNKIILNSNLRILGVNAAGIQSKLKSFDYILQNLKPQIWTVQESKLKPNQKLKCEAAKSFEIFYLNRKEAQGGGLIVGVHKDIESALVREGDDEIEVMVIHVKIGEITAKVINAYGPQENSSKEKKEKFWEFLEEEAIKADLENLGLVIQMDGNMHAGSEVLKNDPNVQNYNGKFLEQFLCRNNGLTVANNLDVCEGSITRQRVLENKTEKAILDLFIINEKMKHFLTKVTIDENRNFCLSNFAQLKKNGRLKETDHNTMIADFAIFMPKKKKERIEMFNLRNINCQKLFTEETEENSFLMDCFDTKSSLKTQSKKWLKTFNTILHKCFKKIRVVNNDEKGNKAHKLLKERLRLKREAGDPDISQEIKSGLEDKIRTIDEELSKEISEEYAQEVLETIESLGGDRQAINGSGRKSLWQMLKKKYPKSASEIPLGKKDKFGNMVTSHFGLKNLYLKTYLHRLRNRPMKNEMVEIKKLKDDLFDKRLELANRNKSVPWTMYDLEMVLKTLKQGKSRDPNGWVRDLFFSEIAGKDLKLSILKLFNRIKEENFIADFIRNAVITTIYEGKGEKSSLENDRGIFFVTTFRTILMKLIYRDKY